MSRCCRFNARSVLVWRRHGGVLVSALLYLLWEADKWVPFQRLITNRAPHGFRTRNE